MPLISGASTQIPIMVEIRTRETSHGGKSVTVFKNGEPTDFKPNIPKMPTPPKQPKENVTHLLKSELATRKNNVTPKAVIVNRVAKRLGWECILAWPFIKIFGNIFDHYPENYLKNL